MLAAATTQRFAACVLIAMTLSACGAPEPPPTGTVVLATTTSVEDAGLLDALLPALRADHPDLRVQVVAVGTGQALALGRRGDADLLIVHAPTAESAFVAAGHGHGRRALMRNDFVVVGPPEDPADVAAATSAVDAFRRIARTGAPFLSRGDSSGTHAKELTLWRAALRPPAPAAPWYSQAGVGMADLLRMASERRAYTLSDRATYRVLSDGLDLRILHAGDARLANPYHLILVSDARNARAAGALADWLLSPSAQTRIGAYGAGSGGQPLFQPAR